MSTRRAILHDIEKFGLNSKKAHSRIKASGHLATPVSSNVVVSVDCNSSIVAETICDEPVGLRNALVSLAVNEDYVIEPVVVMTESRSTAQQCQEDIDYVQHNLFHALNVPVEVQPSDDKELSVLEDVEFVKTICQSVVSNEDSIEAPVVEETVVATASAPMLIESEVIRAPTAVDEIVDDVKKRSKQLRRARKHNDQES